MTADRDARRVMTEDRRARDRDIRATCLSDSIFKPLRASYILSRVRISPLIWNFSIFLRTFPQPFLNRSKNFFLLLSSFPPPFLLSSFPPFLLNVHPNTLRSPKEQLELQCWGEKSFSNRRRKDQVALSSVKNEFTALLRTGTCSGTVKFPRNS